MDINLHKYYIVEEAFGGMSVLPFGFSSKEAACQAVKGFSVKRQTKLAVHRGDKVELVREHFHGGGTCKV
jgi:hypothetical protein